MYVNIRTEHASGAQFAAIAQPLKPHQCCKQLSRRQQRKTTQRVRPISAAARSEKSKTGARTTCGTYLTTSDQEALQELLQNADEVTLP